ncbi:MULTISPECIES: restriction endonuclease subunit S [Flavobacterium]|uniref:Restriction endonuclease subunit S n=1 Tax=Flavobacterium covae TaxID=2906076 RepID=A0ABW8PE59_9FLAO|nr:MULTISPECIES: restriction endonuclease subunit S [Flavobacterium]
MKKLAQVIGFQPKENAKDVFIKKYQNGYIIEIDFEKELINYGNSIKCESKTTQNFSQAENFVVLECVNRLLEKGYKPENITLEKTWAAGHGSSGRLDICVAREDGSEYLLIECKTHGKEFEKEFTRMKKDGGQLFTYFKFSNKADVIMLYSSELKRKEIVYRNEIVKIEEDHRSGDAKDFYEKWSKLTKDNGVFDKWVNPYNFESKALTISDLEEIKQEDSSFIFNRFLEILRHNVVSDKGNAFNRIFTLFLCKIYDEKDKEDTDKELEFQWFESPFTYEGVHYEKDTHVTFQIRLTDLYKKGMKAFLEKNVTDFSESEFNNKYSFLTEEQRSPILQEFRKVRLEKNNEFAIKDVYDEQSFYDNAVVVKEIVELLQGYKLRYTKKQQYLSDFFELLLTTGLKQESGQFFTPVPVAQFVIKSLPIDNIIKQKLQNGEKGEYLPYIIDYAAGSGHFLTETMHEVQRIIDNNEFPEVKAEVKRFIKQAKEFHFDWAFDYVYGIEKDYRLVKVGKVGCYLHGDGLANVIHSDGLANFKHKDYKGKLELIDKNFEQENKQFDIIVSNPPYSVAAFKNAARRFYKEGDFELYDKLTDNSSEIECLFIERTKQLLKDGGVAGIILPSSILSNTGIYSKSREIILQYFDIVGITELGSNTFMATGTNTVTLFLRRRNNYESKNLKIAVNKFFTDFQDVTLNGIEKPVNKYINHVWENISFEDYVSLLKKEPNKTIIEHEIYKEYQKKLKAKNDKEFWNLLLEKETDKLYYFIIAYPQKVVLVKSGEKDAEKRFLGYEFSNRRGSEGIHPIQRGKHIEDCTQLFDAEIFDNPEKASTYIYKAFAGDFDFEIDEAMQNNVSRHNLVDMMTFDRVEFEKNISLSVKKKVKIESKFDLIKIGQIASTQYGFTDKATDKGEVRYLRITDLNDDGSINLNNEAKFINPSDETKKQFLLENNDIVIARSGSVGKSAIYKSDKYDEMIFASYLIRLKANKNRILSDYLFNFTKTQMYWSQVEINSVAVTQPNLNAEKIKEFQIPLPPLDIQQKIVSEIEVLEVKEKKAKDEVEKLKLQSDEIFETINSSTKFLLEDISENLDSVRKPVTKGFRKKGQIPYYGASGIVDYVSDYILDDYVLLISEDGANLKARTSPIAFTASGKIWVNNHAHILKFKEKATHKIVEIYLNKTDISEYITGQAQPKLNQQNLNNIKIPLPTISEQQKIVSEIEKIEAKIKVLETEIAEIPKQKEAVLKKHL